MKKLDQVVIKPKVPTGTWMSVIEKSLKDVRERRLLEMSENADMNVEKSNE